MAPRTSHRGAGRRPRRSPLTFPWGEEPPATQPPFRASNSSSEEQAADERGPVPFPSASSPRRGGNAHPAGDSAPGARPPPAGGGRFWKAARAGGAAASRRLASPHNGGRRQALLAEGGAGPLVAAQARSSLRAAKRSVTALDIGGSSSSFSWRLAQLLRSAFWGAFRDYSGETCSPRRTAEDDWMCMFRISKLPAN